MTLTAYNSIRARLSPPARPVRVQREPRSVRARLVAADAALRGEAASEVVA